MPTPCARDGKGPGHQYGLPDLIEGGAHPVGLSPTPTRGAGTLQRGDARPPVATVHCGHAGSEPEAGLPTPTASHHDSNQLTSARAAARPSLASLAAGLPLPTPSADDRRQDHQMPAGNLTLLGAAALFPTPRRCHGRGPADHGEGDADLRTAVWLLPTPKASDGTKGCPAQRGSKGDLTLPSAALRLGTTTDPAGFAPDTGQAERLLPTPGVAAPRAASTATTTAPGRAGSRPEGKATEVSGGVLPRDFGSWDEAPAAWQRPAQPGPARSWGPYADAVARWELLLGRPAPAPTQPGQHGKPVLAPPFVEWLMGLPPGFVTALPLPRTLALRVLGNGVVPQQAATALVLLLCPHRWAVRP